ncbi:hypothetical protein C2G38_2209969 [Gigaspora rosea]|uniref:Uncharacterized protein n=1 Tax=Gigaspora rosea TaxID=44941 RepID=A0A397UHI0_9GLOM|nr:hypothetical protein C2G38_2209969 [Gigaspora rosea]
MPSTISIVCYVTDHQESVTSKALTVVKASGVTRLRNSASPLNVLLVGFYSKDEYTQDPTVSTLSTFSTEDVLFVTGKFRFIEEKDNDEMKLPILKIILHSVVRLAINPSDLPAFPLLINMTAVVTNLPRNDPDHDDVSFSSATHLTPTTNSLKKGTTLFMNGELLIVENTYVVHLRGINFCEYQKTTLNVKNPVTLPWLSGSSDPPTNEALP